MQPTSTQEITLADVGFASAYVVLPLGKFSKEVGRLRAAIQAHAEARAKAGKPSNVELREVVFAFGHADLLARFEVHDLRSMLRFSFPEDSDAHVLNFILSVPCHVEGDPTDPKKSMRFTMHLRLRRAVYAVDDAVSNELGVIGYLCARLRDAGCAATIHVALGWADLIVDGVFDPTNTRAFADFLVEVHEGAILGPADGERHAIFQRTMTILGFSWPADASDFHPPELRDATPAVFVRGEPGFLREAIERFRPSHNGGSEDPPRFSIRLIDGKSDFVAIAKEPIPDFLAQNLRLASTPRHQPHRIQKLETHLVFSEAPQPGSDPNRRRTVVGTTDKSVPPHCRCHNASLRPLVSANLPESLNQSITNLLFLCHSTLHDQMSCCDVMQAVHSAKIALTRLSEAVDQLHDQRLGLDDEYRATASTDPETANAILEQCRDVQGRIAARLHQLDVWHLLAERVLRQRTVATFDALLLQSDRNIVYRGSVQKFLFLADALMNDFASRISRWHPVPPQFCAMGDSVSRILSLQGMGLVRIPPHHIFTLPFVVPDLWHEVGVFWFYKHADIEKLMPGNAASLSDAELGELGDLYGDLVVVRHGFDGDWSRFAFSLTRAWLDSYDREKLSPSIDIRNFEDLLTRLAFVQIVADSRPHYIDEFIDDARAKKAKYLIKASYEALRVYFPEVPQFTRVAAVTAMLVDKLRRFGKPLQQVFDETIAPVAPPARSRDAYATMIETSDGKLLRFDETYDMNVVMGELYWQFQKDRIARVTNLRGGKRISAPFQRMAGVVRSAILEYHRRQARRGDPLHQP